MRRRPDFTAPAAAMPEPAINITPLIDVMLVLLITLILSIPLATHKVAVDVGGAPTPPVERTIHRIELGADGRLSFDGAPINDAALPARLAAMGDDDDLAIHTDPEARYERFDQVLAAIKRAGVERLGFVNNPERFD